MKVAIQTKEKNATDPKQLEAVAPPPVSTSLVVFSIASSVGREVLECGVAADTKLAAEAAFLSTVHVGNGHGAFPCEACSEFVPCGG